MCSIFSWCSARFFKYKKCSVIGKRLKNTDLRDRFHQNGIVADLPRLGRPRRVRTPEMANYVSSAIAQSPQKSTIRLSAELNIS